jgi:hypothetical protein
MILIFLALAAISALATPIDTSGKSCVNVTISVTVTAPNYVVSRL